MIRDGVRRFLHLALRRRDRWEREVEDEIKAHLAMRAEQLMAEGLGANEAHAEAVRRFGPLSESRARLFEAARHREERMRHTEFLDDLRQDTLFAFRTLGRQKGWTAVTVFTLALGIGATTAVFGVVSSLILHAVPYPAADRVVLVSSQPTGGNNTGVQVSIGASPRLYRAWRDNSRSFESLEPFRSVPVLMATSGDPAQISSARVLPGFADFAGQRPIRGRLFTKAEADDRAHVVVLGETFWRTRFGADERVIGRAITLDDSLYTIIGVVPSALRLPRTGIQLDDVWLPLDVTNDRLGFRLIGRLRPGVDRSVVERELDTLAMRSGYYPPGKKPPFVARVIAPSQMLAFRDSLMMLTAAVTVVLLVACANVAHLLLARGATRRRELAVRAALGAGRTRLLRQLTTESLIVAFSGAALGVLLGWMALHALLALRPPGIVELEAAHLDATTMWVAVGVAILTGVVFGGLAALQAARNPVHDSLKTSAASVSHSRRQDRLRSILVVSETALSAALLVGATLLVRSVINMQRTDLGFEPRGLYGIQIDLPQARYATDVSRGVYLSEALARIRALPGVQDAAASSVGPYGRQFRIGTLEVQGEPAADTKTTNFIDVNTVRPAYFRTMGIPLVAGTTFTDTSGTSKQVIVNAGFARKHWPGSSPIGAHVRIAYTGKGEWMTIVGVAADAMLSGPVTESSAPFLYMPWENAASVAIMIRARDGVDIGPPVRSALRTIDSRIRSPFVASMTAVVQNSIAQPRFTMLILSGFTLMAVLLASVGLYGVMSYSVAQRTQEIGIRMALGATRRAVAGMVMRRGVLLAVAGALLGLFGAYFGSRLLVKLLFGVPALDPSSYAVGGAVLLGAALVACIVPTRRALAVDPMTAIRAE